MESPVPAQIAKVTDQDELLVASVILMEVNQTVRDIRMLVMILLRYVAIGASIADRLVGSVMPKVSEKL
jgi:hypothetical protein